MLNTNIQNTTSQQSFQKWKEKHISQFEKKLLFDLEMRDIEPSLLLEAMTYALTSGGKRLRPLLVYASAEVVNLPSYISDQIAIAIEVIHTYSLIHDDLPSMDNDYLRRGKAACHIAYDEATAILAGDALQALAFEWMTKTQLSESKKNQLILTLAQTIGPYGIAQGQSLDLSWSKVRHRQCTLEDLEIMHRKKTGLLFELCVKSVLIASDNLEKLKDLLLFSKAMGIAFQVHNDLIDITDETSRPSNNDLKHSKLTYPSLLGIEKSKEHCQQHLQEALDYLAKIPQPTSQLRNLAISMVENI